jgi:hypothetical protein
MLKWQCVWLALAVCPMALADGPWDGVWFRDDAKSHRTDHTYSLAKLPNGMWQKDSGDQKYTFRMDGKPYPALPSDFTIAVTQTSPNVLDWVYSGFGRDLQRSHNELSADGKTIASYYSDWGKEGPQDFLRHCSNPRSHEPHLTATQIGTRLNLPARKVRAALRYHSLPRGEECLSLTHSNTIEASETHDVFSRSG